MNDDGDGGEANFSKKIYDNIFGPESRCQGKIS